MVEVCALFCYCLWWLDAYRQYMCVNAHVCFYVCCGNCGNVCSVAGVVNDSGIFSLGVLKYVVCLCRGCDGCCVFCLYCEA